MSLSVIGSLGLFVLGCAIWSPRRRWPAGLVALLGLLLALLSSIHLISDWFTGQGIDESVLYHLSVGLAGAGFAEYLSVMGLAVILLLLSTLFGWGMWRLLRLSPLPLSTWWGLATPPLLLSAWVIHPGSQALMTVGHQYVLASPTGELPEGYVRPSTPVLAKGTAQPKNLVLIYAESLERTYFDEELFPELLPRLNGRQQQGLNFTGIDQLPGMGWTVAGMVGSQCGVPLGRSPGWTGEGARSEFLPLAVCLGDLLADAGYTLHYMGGAESGFAGKGSFYRTHGYSRIEGLEELRQRLDDPADVNAWGLYDDALLPMVAERFDELAERDVPFVLTTLTLDTHHPEGHVSASCREMPYGDGSNPILQAVHCSDWLLDELVEHILNSPHAEDTLVVLMSDHMAMRNTVSGVLDQRPRRNLFLILGADVAPRQVARHGSQLDIAPTVLSLMGFDIPALGLGRDLLGEEVNFHEQHRGSHDALRALYPSLGSLWAYPDLSHGLHVDSQQQQVMVGSRHFDYPVLLQVAPDGKRVVGVLQQGGFRQALTQLPDETGFVWIDACRRNALLSGGAGAICLVTRAAGEALGWQRQLTSHLTQVPAGELWSDESGEPLPEVEELLRRLETGGSLHEHSEGEGRWRVAIANPGMAFIRWQGVSGAAQFSARQRWEEWFGDAAFSPEFDLAVVADSAVPAFRSAWVAAAVVGEDVIGERLSPGDTVDSVARLAFWREGVGAVDLRATGGFLPENSSRFIRVGDETLLAPERGLGVVVLDAQGEQLFGMTYDTYASETESNALAERLDALPGGYTVLLASGDEFTRAMTPALWHALGRLGFALEAR